MAVLPVISGMQMVKILQRQGFEVIRINGSHHRMHHADGRVTTIPVHGSNDLPKGLLRKIIREDLKVDVKEFRNWI